MFKINSVINIKTVLVFAMLSIQMTAQSQENHFKLKANDTEVLDERTGLVWQRCSAGQKWNGRTCAGTAGEFNYEEALAYAKKNPNWRLPTVDELFFLADRSRSNPALDAKIFPGISEDAYFYWTSSPSTGSPRHAWYVNFEHGAADLHFRAYNLSVRLVRGEMKTKNP